VYVSKLSYYLLHSIKGRIKSGRVLPVFFIHFGSVEVHRADPGIGVNSFYSLLSILDCLFVFFSCTMVCVTDNPYIVSRLVMVCTLDFYRRRERC